MQAGLGIRPEFFNTVLDRRPELGFLEAHSENYFGDSIARLKLTQLREDYDVSLHGVGLSLGRADDLNSRHLCELKSLIDQIEPILVSEHLAWSAYSHRHVPDLLPLPLTDQSFSIMCRHVDQMQETLQRQIYVENPSNYLLFDQLQIPEPEFLNALAERTGCGLLIDINNIYVSATNLERDATVYLHQLSSRHIGQYHLAGHTLVERHNESVIIDSHNQTVIPEVWSLFREAVKVHGDRPTIFEWDSDFPEFSVLLDECQKAEAILAAHTAKSAQVNEKCNQTSTCKQSNSEIDERLTTLAQIQQEFLDGVLNIEGTSELAMPIHKHRLWIYQNNVFAACADYLREVYPAVNGLVGDTFFKRMTQLFVQKTPPKKGNIYLYGGNFESVIQEFDALQELPYLKDVIDCEWALHKAYFCSSQESIDAGSMEQQQLLNLLVTFNPSVSIIESQYPLNEIHRQSLPDYQAEVSIDLNQSRDTLLIYKQGHQAKSRVLSDDEAILIKQLHLSENILQAIEQLHGSIGEESLSAGLAMIFDLQLLAHAKR